MFNGRIQVDSREKGNNEVIEYFNLIGQPYFVSKLHAGDYTNFLRPKCVIDLKKDLLEVADNLGKDHARFLREVLRAKNEMSCDLVVLIRKPLQSLEEVKEWHNPLSKVKGETLYKIMRRMTERYGVLWRFCKREDAGAKILSILEWYDKNR
jgi:ribosome-associated protein